MSNRITIKNFSSPHRPTWCPGCGNFGILEALKAALVKLGKKPRDVVICYGIGCAGNMANTIMSYGFHSLHGRALPAALGVRLANPELTVIALAGDGGAYGEGTNHLIHVARTNPNLTLVVANNRTFSLTTGQSSPTTGRKRKTQTSLWGECKIPLNPIALVISSGASFVGRSAAFEMEHLKEILVKAIKHPGFSFVDVMQQCVTFNKVNTIEWYKQRMVNLQEREHDSSDAVKGLERALEDEEKSLPYGIFFEKPRPVYESFFPILKQGPLFKNQRIPSKVKFFIRDFQ